MLSPTCTDAIPPQYWIGSTVLMLSSRSTEQPPQYWCYSSTVLMLFPTCTDALLPHYWCYPSAVLNCLCSTDAILHMYCSYPPQHWTASAVLILSLHSTDAMPRSTEQPPQYWRCTDTIPMQYWNSLCSTEPTLYRVILAKKWLEWP